MEKKEQSEISNCNGLPPNAKIFYSERQLREYYNKQIDEIKCQKCERILNWNPDKRCDSCGSYYKEKE